MRRKRSTIPRAAAHVLNGYEALPRTKRLALAQQLAAADAVELRGRDVAAAVRRLANDGVPQVRQAIASVLSAAPPGLFEAVRDKLQADDNAFVCDAVKRALAQRLRVAQRAQRTRFAADQITQLQQRIEAHYGAGAVRAATQLCERYTQLLVGSMVHDLRSILTHLRANTFALLDDQPSAPRRPQLPAHVRDDLEFLAQTVQDMAAFITPVSSDVQSQRLVDLVTAACEIAAESAKCQSSIDVARVIVDVSIAENLMLPASRRALVAAFVNLIKNAYEAFADDWVGWQDDANDALSVAALADPPRIVITARITGEWVELFIHDNGKGIAQEEADALHLFTPGRRNKSKRNSTGYGLPNAARQIMAHGGTLRFTSTEDRGSTVTVRLPRLRR